MRYTDSFIRKFLSKEHKINKKWKALAGIMAIIVTFSVTYSLIMPAITVSRDQVDEIAGLYLDDSEEVFDIVEDDGDEDEIWTSEGDVIEHTDLLEDDWDGILIEEETEDETEDKSEEIGSGIELEEPAQLINYDAHCAYEEELSTETEAETTAAIELDSEDKEETETESQTEISVETESETEVETKSETKVETESETEVETESETESEIEIQTESETESETEIQTESETHYPAQRFTASEDGVLIIVNAPESAFPEGTTMTVSHVDDEQTLKGIEEAAQTDEKHISRIEAVDICFRDADGNEIEPKAPVSVCMITENKASKEDPVVVHVDDDGHAETVQDAEVYTTGTHDQIVLTANGSAANQAEAETEAEAEAINESSAAAAKTAIEFETEQFSIYAVVYTVDFHYELDGKTFEFGIPGGSFVSFGHLVKALSIRADDTNADNNDVQKLVDSVENITFSNPALLNVSKIEKNTTVGALKKQLGLECEYSAELTEDDITAINAQEAKAGDWALICLKPFDTEETLTVTMKNGDQWTIRITDAQIKKTVISASGETYEITVTYMDNAEIPEGAELRVEEITEEVDHQAYVTKTQEALGRETDDSSDRFFDISIIDKDGNEIQPAAAVSVEIRLLGTEIVENTQVVHFGETPELMDLERDPDSLNFYTNGFSVFAVVTVESEEGSYVFHGDGYTVKITHTAEAEIPLGTTLTVRELDPESDEYIQRLGQAWYEVNREYFEVEEMRENYNEGMGNLPELNLVNLDAARFFDINFEYNGEKIEPNDAVTVEISYDEGLKALGDGEPVRGVAHFGKENVELIEDVETETDENGDFVSFKYEQSSFSDTGTYVGQETYDAKTEQRMAPAPVYDPEKAVTLPALGASAGSGNTLTDTGSSNSTLPAPASSKTLTPNKTSEGKNDGTYTLTLSVAGSSKSTNTAEVTRSNVLIVMDRSSSMVNNKVKIYTPYNGRPKNGVTYYGKEGDSYFQLFTNNNRYYKTRTQSLGGYNYSDVYTGQVYTATEGDRRLDAEQEALSSLISQLLAKNNEFKRDSQGYLLDDNNERVLDEDGQPIKVNDIIEISVISFADQRLDNTFTYPSSIGGTHRKEDTEVDWTTNYNDLIDGSPTNPKGVMSDFAPSGTNWEDALQYAKDVADAKHTAQPDEPMFVLFLTDGEPTAYAGETYKNGSGAHHYNNVGGGFIAAYEQAKDDARALVTAGYQFYGIFTYGEGEEQVGYLRRLVNVAYGHEDDTTKTDDLTEHFHDAGDNEALLAAFEHILSRISGSLSVGNVTVADGLTTDATTSTLVSGQAGGFRYTVTGPLGELYSVTASGSDDNPTVTFTINGEPVSGEKKTEHVTRNQVDNDGNPIPDPSNPGKYLTVTEDKTYYSATVGTTEYKMALANIDSTGQITWDLSAVGTLLSGYSYNCSFVVWPDQDAYDYVAGLNNGLDGFEWNQNAATAVRNEKGDVVYWTGGVTTGGPNGHGYPSIVKYPNGIFAVLTNTNQSVTYSIVDTKTDETTGETETTYDGPYNIPLEYPDPMPLTGTSSQLEKVWNINRDPSILYKYLYESKDEEDKPKAFDIGFVIERDGEKYKEIHLPGNANVTNDGVSYDWSTYDNEDLVTYNGKTFSTRWSQDFSIATGLMLSEAQMDARSLDKSQYTDKYKVGDIWYYVLEPGHDFKISEPAVGYEFDFEAPIYHPMLVDGVLMDVKFSAEGGTKHIIEMKQLEIDTGTGKSALSVINTLRGYINVKKKVVDSDGTTPLTTDDTEFTFNVELSNDLPVFEGDHIPWYGINGLYYHDVNADDDYYQAEYVNGVLQVTTEEGGPYDGVGNTFNPDNAGEQTITYIVDGNPVSVTICGNQMTPEDGSAEEGYKKVTGTAKITQTEKLYIANVPVNTHYSITEVAKNGYQLIGIEHGAGTTGEAAGAGVIDPNIEGTIVPNAETLITYTNKRIMTDISIQKLSLDGKELAGAVFQLKKVGNEGISETPVTGVEGLTTVTKTVNGQTRTFESAFESTGGVQTLSGLTDGKYRLYEVYFPDGYISSYKYIEFTIDNLVMKDVTTDTEDTSKLVFTPASGNKLALLQIKNEPGAALPSTGGPGTDLTYLLGIMLTGLAGAGLVMRRKRKAA